MMLTFREFLDECKSIESGYVVAAMTDCYIVDIWPLKREEIVEEKLLEIRVFNKGMEAKLFRSDISKKFSYRMINDYEKKYEAENSKELDYSDYFDDYQYLDIDTKKSEKSFRNEKVVISTGGGSYYLPMDKMIDVMIKLRMYFGRYPDTGQARVFDWRVVDFVEKRGE